MGLAEISPRDLHALLGREAVAVFDVNAESRWLERRVPGARHLDAQGFAAADLGADPDALLVFYCSGPLCRKAPNAARRAKGFGFRNVKVLSAGVTGWVAAGMPTETGAAAGG